MSPADQAAAATFPQPSPRASQVVFSASRVDKPLGMVLYHAVQDQGLASYYDRTNRAGIVGQDDYFKDWLSALEGGASPIVIYSKAYEASNNCMRELEAILARLKNLPIRPFTFVALTKHLPPGVAELDSTVYFHIPAYELKEGEVITMVIERLKLLNVVDRCPRRDLLSRWHPLAAKRISSPFVESKNAAYKANPELHESNLALAAAIGFNEQLTRAMRVLHSLGQIAAACEADKQSHGGPCHPISRQGLSTAITTLLSLFRIDKDRYAYSDDDAEQDEPKQRLRRLSGYLLHHCRGGADTEVVAEFREHLEQLRASNRGRRPQRFFSIINRVQSQAMNFLYWLTLDLPAIAERCHLEGSDVEEAARKYSLTLAAQLRKGVPACGI